MTPTDRPALERLFELRSLRERALELGMQAMLLKGSTGQLRVNPLLEYVGKLEAAIARLEGEFGLTPLARIRMGLAVTGQGPPTLQDLRRGLDESAGARPADSRSSLLGGEPGEAEPIHDERDAAERGLAPD